MKDCIVGFADGPEIGWKTSLKNKKGFWRLISERESLGTPRKTSVPTTCPETVERCIERPNLGR